ncbi:hypothetical protein Pelo_9467 [Pelomyxa schiedti]|nr:hypothetical protein Pelo_9467 [Pelomyxa schiedti]
MVEDIDDVSSGPHFVKEYTPANSEYTPPPWDLFTDSFATYTPPTATAETTCGPARGSIVPEWFGRQCDDRFDALPKWHSTSATSLVAHSYARSDMEEGHGLVRWDVAWDEWRQLGEPEFVTKGVADAVEKINADGAVVGSDYIVEDDVLRFGSGVGAVGHSADLSLMALMGEWGGGVSRRGFALGCYLLASRQPGSGLPPAPSRCLVGPFLESGFALSYKVEKLCKRERNVFYTRLMLVLLLLNLIFSIPSTVYWYFAPLSLLSCAIGCYLSCFCWRYPFLIHPTLARSIIAFAVLGCLGEVLSFMGISPCYMSSRACTNVKADAVWRWYYTFVVFELIYSGCSTAGLYLIFKKLREMLHGTLAIQIPEITHSKSHSSTTKGLFAGGWVALCCSGSILLLTGFPTQDRKWSEVVFLVVIVVALACVSFLALVVTTRRRYVVSAGVPGIVTAATFIMAPIYMFPIIKCFNSFKT